MVSCNAYFAQLGTYAVGPEALLETAKLYGISVAKPNTPKQLKDALPQASYGQGQVVATPFQMARVAAAVAANGAAPEGRWVTGEGNTRRGEAARVVEPALAQFLGRAMRRVVTEGTAARFLAGVTPAIAGKTGTAEVQDKGSHSWFIGYAPYPTQGGGRSPSASSSSTAATAAGSPRRPRARSCRRRRSWGFSSSNRETERRP